MGVKQIILVFVSVFITAFAMYLINTFTQGSDALTEDQILSVLKKGQVTYINGEKKTYGEALSGLSTNQAVIISKQETMQRALEALAAE